MDVYKLDLPGNWMAFLKEDDERQLKLIYHANYPKIRDYVLENSGSEADAKDIYHEAFLNVWRNIQLDKVQFLNVDKFQGYLFRVAQYNWIDQLRKKKRHRTDSIESMDISEVADINLPKEQEEYLEKVKSVYSEMGDPCKDLLHRFYFLKQKMKEIATAHSWTEATAKNNKYRCLERLRKMVLSTIKQ